MSKVAAALVLAFAVPVPRGLAAECYDFDMVDAFAGGAVLGRHVSRPVEGFDLLLMRDGRVVFHRAYGDWQLDQRDRDGILVGALAAGARGFSAWIDVDDRMVGVFATDRTTSGNVRELVDLLRAAAEIAVRNPQPCEPRQSGKRVRP